MYRLNIRKILPIIFLTLTWNVKALTLDPGIWYNFSGNLHQQTMLLTLFKSNTNHVSGYYCSCTGADKVVVTGLVNNQFVQLNAFEQGKQMEQFTLQLISDSSDRLQGYYIRSGQSEKTNVYFYLQSEFAGSAEQRYANNLGVDNDVETFMKSIQKAVQIQDKLWLSEHIQYPINISLNSKKRVQIKSPQQFRKWYSSIFTPTFTQQIISHCTAMLFSNSNGIMLGNGDIWINQKQGSTQADYDFVIIAINR